MSYSLIPGIWSVIKMSLGIIPCDITVRFLQHNSTCWLFSLHQSHLDDEWYPDVPRIHPFPLSETDFMGPLSPSNGPACLLEWPGLKSICRQSTCGRMLAPPCFMLGFSCSLTATAVQNSPHSLAYPWDWWHSPQFFFLPFEAFSKISITWSLLIVAFLLLVLVFLRSFVFFPQPHVIAAVLPFILSSTCLYLASSICHALWLQVDNIVLGILKF